MDNLENEIRQAFERRLAAVPPHPDLRARVREALARRSSHPQTWKVAAGSAAILLVGAVTFYALMARHLQPVPVVRPQGVHSPTPTGTETSPTTWVQVHPSTTPSARGEAAAVYDASTHQVVLFGGDTLVGDTWVWEGHVWIRQQPAMSPPARSNAAMVYDQARGVVVLFGGGRQGTLLGDTWTWSRKTWTEQQPSMSPAPRDGASIAYDSLHHAIVLFGGHAAPASSGSGQTLNDTWIWDGGNWTELHPATSPPPRQMAAMAYDATAGKVVLFGGLGLNGDRNDTWAWDGTDWARLSPFQSPSGRYSAGMAYDSVSGRILLFGGLMSGSMLDDTWSWNGSTWTQQLLATKPPARIAPAFAYDAAYGTLLLFGGQTIGASGRITDFADTWLWTGR
jgi:hypothetical protein